MRAKFVAHSARTLARETVSPPAHSSSTHQAALPDGTSPAIGEECSRPRWLWLLDRFSVAACLLAWSIALAWVGPAWLRSASESVGLAGLLLAGIVVGYLLADLASGTVHWLADRYFDPSTPILGPALIAPFREHHEDPLAMTRHDFFETSGNNGLATIPLAGFVAAAGPPDGAIAVLLTSALASLGLFVFATNQFHRWAHAHHPPRFARALQRRGLILSPTHHARHHRGRNDRAYCVTSGWLNPLLDRIGFFARIERRIACSARSTHPAAAALRERDRFSVRKRPGAGREA